MMAQLQVVQVLWKPEQLGLCGVVGRGLLGGGGGWADPWGGGIQGYGCWAQRRLLGMVAGDGCSPGSRFCAKCWGSHWKQAGLVPQSGLKARLAVHV